MNLIQQLEKEQFEKLSATKTIPEFGPGDTVIVNVKVVEGERSRVQAYEGVCIGRSGGGLNESFTVRKISYGEGVERVFPVMSPMIDSIKVVRRGKVRRAKLYYLRQLRGKSARIVEKRTAPTPSTSDSSFKSGCRQKRGVWPRAFFFSRPLLVIASAAKQSPSHPGIDGLLRRSAPRNDGERPGSGPAARNSGGNKRISHLNMPCVMSSEWF